MKLVVALLALAVSSTFASARDTMDGIFNERVRTVRVARGGDDYFSPPVAVLGSGDFLTVSFDHLSDDRAFLRYRVVRCDANWQPSRVVESEWLDGFNESTIDDYEFSQAVTVHYVKDRKSVV